MLSGRNVLTMYGGTHAELGNKWASGADWNPRISQHSETRSIQPQQLCGEKKPAPISNTKFVDECCSAGVRTERKSSWEIGWSVGSRMWGDGDDEHLDSEATHILLELPRSMLSIFDLGHICTARTFICSHSAATFDTFFSELFACDMPNDALVLAELSRSGFRTCSAH